MENSFLQIHTPVLRKKYANKKGAAKRMIAPSMNVLVALFVIKTHHKIMQFLHSKYFWRPFFISALLCSAFFAWEINFLPRPEPTKFELLFTVVLVLLLSLNAGLAFYRMQCGTCPIGAKRASTIAGGLSIITLLCPACLLIPVSLFGISLSLTILTPFLPLLRGIVLLLLVVSTILLWPKSN